MIKCNFVERSGARDKSYFKENGRSLKMHLWKGLMFCFSERKEGEKSKKESDMKEQNAIMQSLNHSIGKITSLRRTGTISRRRGRCTIQDMARFTCKETLPGNG